MSDMELPELDPDLTQREQVRLDILDQRQALWGGMQHAVDHMDAIKVQQKALYASAMEWWSTYNEGKHLVQRCDELLTKMDEQDAQEAQDD